MGSLSKSYNLSHRAHNYTTLVKRWKALASKTRLEITEFCEHDNYPVFVVRSPALEKSGGIYISAGIHGDEPAGTEALIGWAESKGAKLRELPLMLFPCLNPWGLVNNTRLDASGRDLNRHYHSDEIDLVSAHKALFSDMQFTLCLTLHEDYDGQGLYIYEVKRHEPFWAEELLLIAKPIIPIESRLTIDGRRARDGVVRRKIRPKTMPMYPEAVYLHLKHSVRTFTFETPSEFALDQRVRAQIALIQECIKRTLAA